MKTSIIVHGHFYQPPREDPYTGIVPFQETPDNCINWNEQIYRTCYLPNAYSRYLDFTGKVSSITNNYSYISSNFGPTLLKWMDEAHPEFLPKLKEADRISMKQTGHSNFLAQCYNHTILPLENIRTKNTEVKWAIEDYCYRFGHRPEGFWCAECAIDKETVDVLADNGILFVVLSPWQASAIDGKPLNGKSAPCDRAFYIEGFRNKIVAFFYDPELASGISFGHLLRDADGLFEKLRQMRTKRHNPALIHWATDGEIYGHHESFGDMALAALIRKLRESDEFEITNYGAFLEKHGVSGTAELYLGVDGRGSSWSCSHGVGRWHRNCGCHTGGPDTWNQKWRGPMRTAFNHLEEKTREIFDREIRSMLGSSINPDTVIEGFGKVLSGRFSVDSYVKSFKSAEGMNLTDEQATNLAILLDAMKNCMFSYTSCGWFFNDISGIEPAQCIRYGICCANRLQPFAPRENLLVSLMKDLSEAHSNISSVGTGEDIAKHLVRSVPGSAEASGFFILNRILANPSMYRNTYGIFKLVDINDTQVTVRDNLTLEEIVYTYEEDLISNDTLSINLRNRINGFTYSFTNKEITKLTKIDITKWTNENLSILYTDSVVNKVSLNIEKYMFLFESDIGASIDNMSEENASFCAKLVASYVRRRTTDSLAKEFNVVWPIVNYVKNAGKMSDYRTIKNAFDRLINLYAKLAEGPGFTQKAASNMLQILSRARKEQVYPDITSIQNSIYPVIEGAESSLDEETVYNLRRDLNFVY
ncbi:MAG: DUF3536 domain-containing protein [Sphaerochaetaceae bacterium]|nr:DUF3536 domain-containing protein [Sphaerochaetaceae bacterium]